MGRRLGIKTAVVAAVALGAAERQPHPDRGSGAGAVLGRLIVLTPKIETPHYVAVRTYDIGAVVSHRRSPGNRAFTNP